MTQPALPLELDPREIPRGVALALLDNMIATKALYLGRTDPLSEIMLTERQFLQQIRPHLLSPLPPGEGQGEGTA